jgi:hypothetical protein
VRTSSVDLGQRVAEVRREWVFGGQGVGADPDLYRAVTPRGEHKTPMDQPVAFSTNLVTASAANTTVGWASMDSRLWW